ARGATVGISRSGGRDRRARGRPARGGSRAVRDQRAARTSRGHRRPGDADAAAGRSVVSVAAVTALAPAATAVIVRSLGATLRIRAVGVDALEPRWRAGQPLIYAVWHGRMVMMPWLNAWLRRTRGARRVAVLASRSRDGEIVSRYVARFGLATIRGSSSRSEERRVGKAWRVGWVGEVRTSEQ